MRTLVVGLGNERRGDDAAGLVAARRLWGEIGGDVAVVEHPGEPVDLIVGWGAFDLVVLVDAARGPPGGAIQRFEHGADPLPPGHLGASSHAFDLSVAIGLAASLGRLPPRLVLYTVGGERFGFGDPMSDAARGAVDDVAELVREEVRQAAVPTARTSAPLQRAGANPGNRSG